MLDGTLWYAYANNNPLSFLDPTGLWVIKRDGTAVAQPGDTLWALSAEVSGKGTRWTELTGFTGDPTKMPVGTVVNWTAMSRTMTAYNRDPTSGSQVAEFGGTPADLDVGHSWMDVSNPATGTEWTLGWGYGGDRAKLAMGLTQPGALVDTANQGQPGPATSQFSRMITEVEAAKVLGLWNAKLSAGMSYNYGGSAVDPPNAATGYPGATYCTQALLDVLKGSGILTLQDQAILDAPYPTWGSTVPSSAPPYVTAPGGLRDTYGHLTDPTPDAVEDRFKQLDLMTP